MRLLIEDLDLAHTLHIYLLLRGQRVFLRGLSSGLVVMLLWPHQVIAALELHFGNALFRLGLGQHFILRPGLSRLSGL